jgi:ribonuclease E
MNEKRKEVNNINENNQVNIIIVPNADLESPKYKLVRYRADNDDTGKNQVMSLLKKITNQLMSSIK